MSSKLLIASAGAGKTTYLVEKAIKISEPILITTFTQENEKEIRRKFRKLNRGVIPSNVTIKTWFSFLLQHGVKPYQGKLTEKRIKGLLLVSKKSGLKYIGKFPVYFREDEVDQHYFSPDYQIFSDKIAKFVIRSNEMNKGAVINRIGAIFDYIFIDEIQDMAGYDLEIVKLLLHTKCRITLAGDPRQVTYHTHDEAKYKKYKDGKIDEFIRAECKGFECEVDMETLKDSWRNNTEICKFANRVFPEYPCCESLQSERTNHDGVFLVKKKDVDYYLEKYSPLQLRDTRTRKVNEKFPVMNFGESKGSTHERVLLYPTKPITDWLSNNSSELKSQTRCKFYVALTRAKFSVGIVCENNTKISSIPIFERD